MLNKYALSTIRDYENALKEIIQQIALLGLWRSDFYTKCAFYGGSALRILYGLDRFSEDLDFTLLGKKSFDIENYLKYIRDELYAFGFQVEVARKEKTYESPIESAFVKANTYLHLLYIETPEDITRSINQKSKIKIKLEVDIDPPENIEWETKYILEPIPFNVTVVKPSFMFSGKVHTMLYRKWKNRVKGRDWYDFVWFISQKIPLNLKHLIARIEQTEEIKLTEPSQAVIKEKIREAIEETDLEQAKKDVLPFLKREDAVRVWSREFFLALIEQIQFE